MQNAKCKSSECRAENLFADMPSRDCVRLISPLDALRRFCSLASVEEMQNEWEMGMCCFCLRIARKGRGGTIHPRGERPSEGLERAKNGVSDNEGRTLVLNDY